jgi:hypothetical protein
VVDVLAESFAKDPPDFPEAKERESEDFSF